MCSLIVPNQFRLCCCCVENISNISVLETFRKLVTGDCSYRHKLIVVSGFCTSSTLTSHFLGSRLKPLIHSNCKDCKGHRALPDSTRAVKHIPHTVKAYHKPLLSSPRALGQCPTNLITTLHVLNALQSSSTSYLHSPRALRASCRALQQRLKALQWCLKIMPGRGPILLTNRVHPQHIPCCTASQPLVSCLCNHLCQLIGSSSGRTSIRQATQCQ